MIYIYQLLLKVLSKEQRLPLTLSDEKHTGKVNIMKIESTVKIVEPTARELSQEELDFLDSLEPEKRRATIRSLERILDMAALQTGLTLIHAAMDHALQGWSGDAAGGLMDDIDGIQDPGE